MLLIKVTQKDIDFGRRANSLHCPISLAAKKRTPKNIHIYTNTDAICFYKSCKDRFLNSFHRKQSRRLPKIAQTFIYNFDRDKEVHPIQFEIKDLDTFNQEEKNE